MSYASTCAGADPGGGWMGWLATHLLHARLHTIYTILVGLSLLASHPHSLFCIVN